jgi:hypothetical protein
LLEYSALTAVCRELVSIKFEFVINAARALDSTFPPSWLTGLTNKADHLLPTGSYAEPLDFEAAKQFRFTKATMLGPQEATQQYVNRRIPVD